MNTRIFLLRHGETLSNLNLIYQGQGDSTLSELGLKEAKELAQALKGEEFSAIYSSSLIRAYDTAKIIAEPHKLEVKKVLELMEINYGVFEGHTFEEIREKYSDIYHQWLQHPHLARIPGAETLDQLSKRGIKAINQIIDAHPKETVCVVGHGGINRCILFHFMNLELDNFWRIKQDNCCINIIELDRHPMVTLLNSTWFLGEKRVNKIGIY